jgi:uncharacterized caspase-like protein
MRAALSSLGFDVTLAKNVGYADFCIGFEAFARKIEPGDTVFFYAGHGIGQHGANFLLPSGVPPVDLDIEQLLRRSIAEGLHPTCRRNV